MKQKKMYKVIPWLLSISLMFQATGITSFAFESEVGKTTVSMQEELVESETPSSSEESIVEESSETEVLIEETESVEKTEAEEEIFTEEVETVIETELLPMEEVEEESSSYNDVQEGSDTFEVDFQIYEVISESDRTVRLKEVNRNSFNYYYQYENPVWGDIEITVPSNVSNEGITYNVVEIGEFAFADYTFDLEYGNPFQGYDEYVNNLYVNKITVSDGVKKICGGAFYRMYNLKELVLPDSVEEIGSSAFVLDEQRIISSLGEDPTLLNVNIPKNVKSIGSYAYAGVTFEGTLTIPDGVETIGEYAFGWDDSFDNYSVVEIPASVTTIGKNAFCSSSLVKAVLAKTTLPTLVYPSGENEYSTQMFGEHYLTNLLVHVPVNLIEGYQSSNLSYYVSGIQFADIADYVPEETVITETFHFSYNGNTVTQLDIKLTQTAFVNVVLNTDNITLNDIIWELTLTDGLEETSTDPADFLQFTDNKNGILTLKAKKAGYLRLTGKVTGYENVILDISNLYTTDEESRAFIERMNTLTQEEIQALSVIQKRMGSQEQIAEIRQKAEEIVKDCTTDRERIFAIEQWLASHVAYDYDYLAYHEDGVTSIKVPPYSPYEVFKNHFTVCGGYANLAEVMIRSIGIPCVQIFGLAGDTPDNKAEDHAWNAAYDADSGEWIYFDATWDSRNALNGSVFFSSTPDTYWFDFDVEAVSGSRFFSASSLDGEDYETYDLLKCHYITLYEGETKKLEFLDDVEYSSLVAKGDYLEWDYDFGTKEKVQREDTFITVDMDGNVTGIKEGMGIIEIDNGFGMVHVRVLAKEEQAFSKETYTVELGSSTLVETVLADSPTTGLMKFTSDNTDVVIIDDKGILTPVTVGTATITGHLYCNDSYSISCNVVVVETIEEEIKVEFEQNDIQYEVLTKPEGNIPGTVSVIGESFTNLESANAISVNIPETVVYEEETYTVTQIGPKAFAQLIGVATVSIPASVQRIEREAFYGPRSKVGADLSGELIFPENSQLEYIGYRAFSDNPKLTKVDLSNCTKLQTIGEYAFSDCSYSSVNMDGSLSEIGIIEVVLPDNLKIIDSYAFSFSQKLTTINIPARLEVIGKGAFDNTDLKGVLDFSGVKEVGEGILKELTDIEGVILNDSWTKIPDKMFYGLPVKWVASESCLEKAGGVDSIETGSLFLSENIIHIGEEAFSNCYKIKIVEAPGVKSIGKKAFLHCTEIESFDFEQNLTVIPEKAFMNCSALKEFTMNTVVTEIGYGAFYGCSKLSDMRISSDKITKFGDRCFSKGTTFYIPLNVSNSYMRNLKSYAVAFYDLDGNLLESIIKYVEAYLKEYPVYNVGDSYEVIRNSIRVYIEYTDKTFEDVMDFDIEKGTFTEGGQEITISYLGFTDTIIVGSSENQNPIYFLSVRYPNYEGITYKTGDSFQTVKDVILLRGNYYDSGYEILENYDVHPGYFVDGDNTITISYCDFVGGNYKTTLLYADASDEILDEPVDDIKALHVEFVPDGGLEYPKAGHIVSSEDIKVSHLVQTAKGMEYRETSDYTITGAELKKGDNTVIISSFDSEGKVITYEIFVYAAAQLDAFDVELKEGVKLKAGDIIDTTMFVGTASYIGENSYTHQEETEYFLLEGDMIVQEGENTFTFSYTEYTVVYGEITKYAQWDMSTDDKPVLSTSTLDINQYSAVPVGFEVYAPSGKTPQLDGVFYQNDKGVVQEGISYTADKNGVYMIQIPSVLKNKSYKLYIKVKIKETDNIYYLPIKLTLKTTLPKITATAEKMNLFFTDEDNRTSTITLKNPSAEVIRSIAFEENSSMDKYFDVVFDQETQALGLKLTDSNVAKKDLISKGKLLVYTENYNKPIVVNVNISVSDKQPKMKVSPSSATINTRLYDDKEITFEVTMQEGKVYVPVTLNGMATEPVTCAELISQISTVDNKVTLNLKNTSDFNKAKTVKMKVQAANWKTSVPITCKIKTVNTLPKVVLDTKTLTLDQRAVGALATTTLRFDTRSGDITYKDLPDTLTAVKNDAIAPKVILGKNTDGSYTVKAAYVSTMKKGTYKYEITPELSDGTKLKKVTLSVKVTTATKAATATLKAQKGGKIDLISRSSTKYVYAVTPTVKGTFIKNAVLKKVTMGNTEVPVSLFDVKMNEQDGVVSTIEVSASEKGDFSSGKKYNLTFEITPATETQELTHAEAKVSITPKEGTLKVNVNMKNAVLYRNIPYVKAVYKVMPQTEGVKISKMEYISSTKVPEGAFEITQTDTATYQISIKDKTKVNVGQTYKLTFKVQAEGGNKTITQNLSIKIQ